MRVAVIGWGSLIWNQRELASQTGWYKDGPLLPVEFARLSGRERITLVLGESFEPQPTCWTLSSFHDVEEARENLRIREGRPPSHRIHALMNGHAIGSVEAQIVDAIDEWLESKELDAAVWTGLESNWEKKRKVPFKVEDAIAYLHELDDPTAAEEYIRKTPSMVRTVVRELVETEFGWTPLEPPENVYED